VAKGRPDASVLELSVLTVALCLLFSVLARFQVWAAVSRVGLGVGEGTKVSDRREGHGRDGNMCMCVCGWRGHGGGGFGLYGERRKAKE
jgi:hypothetical protein